jgi:hypothetical protein
MSGYLISKEKNQEQGVFQPGYAVRVVINSNLQKMNTPPPGVIIVFRYYS